jgi:hypothetical protein
VIDSSACLSSAGRYWNYLEGVETPQLVVPYSLTNNDGKFSAGGASAYPFVRFVRSFVSFVSFRFVRSLVRS